MLALIVFSAVMMVIGIVLVVLSIILLVKSKDAVGWLGMSFGMVVFLIFMGIFGDGCDKYHSPHHGEDPTLDDVNEGKAYIDKTKMIHGNDTTYHYEFQWKK